MQGSQQKLRYVTNSELHARPFSRPMLFSPLLAALLGLSTSVTTRRDVMVKFSAASVLALSPFAAFADGANSAATAQRARAIYGSRVFRLQSKSAQDILDDKNVIRLFITGTYRGEGGQIKADKKKLLALEKEIISFAEAGDSSKAQEKLKQFVAEAKITELDNVAGGSFNPKQRRNAGAPETSAIEKQMGTESFALYAPTKDAAKGVKLTN